MSQCQQKRDFEIISLHLCFVFKFINLMTFKSTLLIDWPLIILKFKSMIFLLVSHLNTHVYLLLNLTGVLRGLLLYRYFILELNFLKSEHADNNLLKILFFNNLKAVGWHNQEAITGLSCLFFYTKTKARGRFQLSPDFFILF